MTPPIPAELLEEAPGNLVQLFEIDMTPIQIHSSSTLLLYLTPATEGTPPATVARDGITYQAVPIAGEGYERGGTGALPQPVLTVANVEQLVAVWVEGAQDLLGALVTRTVVLADWLDGAPGADPTAAISVDTYVIGQKTVQDKNRISFSLRSPLEVRRDVPFRKAIARCSHTYRRSWTGSSFTAGSCPYVGGSYFDYFDASTGTAADDFCSRKLKGCQLRFPGVSLPFRGFPSLG